MGNYGYLIFKTAMLRCPAMPCLCTSPRHPADQRRAHRAGRQQVARRHGLLVRRVRRIGHGEANRDGVGIYMGSVIV